MKATKYPTEPESLSASRPLTLTTSQRQHCHDHLARARCDIAELRTAAEGRAQNNLVGCLAELELAIRNLVSDCGIGVHRRGEP